MMKMPQNWKTYKLSDALEIKYGKDHKKIEDGKIPIYGTGGIMRYGNQSLYDQESILIPRKGSLNNIYYINEPFWTVDTLFWSKINTEIVDAKYLFYSLKLLDFANMDVGSAIPSLTTSLLNRIEIVIPELPEQRAIASILSALDDKIELNLQMNKTLEEMAMALYKHWFVDFGPFKDGKFVESELGMIPEGWEVKSIYSIADYINGASFKVHEFTDDIKTGYPIVKIVEIKQGISSQTKHSKKVKDPKYIINNEDILFSWSGNPETSLGIFLWDKGEAYLNQHIFKVIPKISEHKNLILTILKATMKEFIKMASHKQTTGLGHITVQNLKETNIIYPDLKTVKLFLTIVDPIISKLFENQIEIINLTDQRDYLLPKLISGEIQVNDINKNLHAFA